MSASRSEAESSTASGDGAQAYRHVLCVYPYRVELSRHVHWPPLGLEFIAAALRPYAKEIDVIDLRRESGNAADFVRPDTDLICVSVNWGLEGDFVRETIRSLPEKVTTIAGGRHVSEDPEIWLNDCPNIDVVVRGDGEEAIDEIARGIPLEKIDGISYRTKDGLSHTRVRDMKPLRDDLYPDRSLRRYTYSVPPEAALGSVTLDSVAASRGCPFNCTFCSFDRNPWGKKRSWSARSPESVVDELEQVESKYIIFVDDNFTHDMDRVGAICDLILERGIRKRYAVNARVEVARRPDVLRKMERAGFAVLLLGVESAQDKTLRSMRKGFTTKQLRKYFKVLRKTRMILHGYFIIGAIGESEKEMLEIAPFARELGLDSVGLCTLRNGKYTGLEELVAASPGYHIKSNGDIYSDDIPTSRLREIRHIICRHFYYRPGHVLHMLSKMLRNDMLPLKMLMRLPGFLMRKIVRWLPT